MKLIADKSGIIQVGEADQLGVLARNELIPDRDGFFCVLAPMGYGTNRSHLSVSFDNLEVTRWKPVVRVAYVQKLLVEAQRRRRDSNPAAQRCGNYYPYGLTWKNPDTADDEQGIHDCTYQDKEFQFAEFSDGHGLALHDFHARMYDGATGRWLVPDPAGQFANPYLAMGNNPVSSVDPDGRFVEIIAGAVIGAVANVVIAGVQGNLTGDNWYKYAAVGALAGGLGVATGGGAMSLMGGGSFGAGFIGSSAAASASGFGAGAVSGAAGGLASGFANGAGSGWIQNNTFSQSMEMGFEQSVIGGMIGFGMGGIASGIGASKHGKDFWSGKDKASSTIYSGQDGNSVEASISSSDPTQIVDRAELAGTIGEHAPNTCGAPVLDVVPSDAILSNGKKAASTKMNDWTSIETYKSKYNCRIRYKYYWAPRDTQWYKNGFTYNDSFWAVPQYYDPIWNHTGAPTWIFDDYTGIKVHP